MPGRKLFFNLTANKSKFTEKFFKIWFYIGQKWLRFLIKALSTYLLKIIFVAKVLNIFTPFTSRIACTATRDAPSKLQSSRCLGKDVAAFESYEEQRLVSSGPPRFWYHRLKALVQTLTTNSNYISDVPRPSQHSSDFGSSTNDPINCTDNFPIQKTFGTITARI